MTLVDTLNAATSGPPGLEIEKVPGFKKSGRQDEPNAQIGGVPEFGINPPPTVAE